MPIVGEIRSFAFRTNGAAYQDILEQGWLPCDGRSLNQDDYRDLLKAIGVDWGSDDSANSFCIPDLSGLFLRGVGLSDRNVDSDVADRVGGRSDLVPAGGAGTAGATGNAVGSWQPHGFESHKHEYVDARKSAPGSLREEDGVSDGHGHGSRMYTVRISPKGASETRPSNVYVLYAIFSGKRP